MPREPISKDIMHFEPPYSSVSRKWDIYYTFSMRTNFGSFEIFINSSNLITLF